jgi:archaemetzincin
VKSIRLLFTLLVITGISSCVNDKKNSSFLDAGKHRIILLPFEGMDTRMTTELKAELQKRLLAEITIAKKARLPVAAYYQKRQRYIADSLLVFLGGYSKDASEKVLGVTASDISTGKEGYSNWGVMGLAYCPGRACVISSYRVKRTSRNRQHLIRRMTVLALHELGHAYALPHCTNSCLMHDATGKMNLDNTENYCASCFAKLKKRGVLQ